MADGYEDPQWAKDYVVSEIGDEPMSLEVDLELMAGLKPDGVTKVYRPNLYCARYLDRRKGLLEGDGAKFRVEQRVAAYLKAQVQLDATLELTVPPGSGTGLEVKVRPLVSRLVF